jgi:hypothetical protein
MNAAGTQPAAACPAGLVPATVITASEQTPAAGCTPGRMPLRLRGIRRYQPTVLAAGGTVIPVSLRSIPAPQVSHQPASAPVTRTKSPSPLNPPSTRRMTVAGTGGLGGSAVPAADPGRDGGAVSRRSGSGARFLRAPGPRSQN